MKFLWFFILAISALLFIQITTADDLEDNQSVPKTLEIIDNNGEKVVYHDKIEKSPDNLNEEVRETKLEKAEKDKEDVQDDENEKENEMIPQELIAAEDIEAFKGQPEMHRLARSLRSFHNSNILDKDYELRQYNLNEEDDYDDVFPEERGIRKRQRVRRRRTKNKIKRFNRNKNVSKRRKSYNRRSKNKNSVHRNSNRKSSANKRSNRRSSSPKRRNTRRYSKRGGSRRHNHHSRNKRKRSSNHHKRGFSTRSGHKRHRSSKKKSHQKEEPSKSEETTSHKDKHEQQEQMTNDNEVNAAIQPAENTVEAEQQ